MLAHRTLACFANQANTVPRHVSRMMSISTGQSIDLSLFPDHKSLMIEKYGEPSEHVQLRVRKPEEVLPKQIGPKEIIVEHLVSSINPADINLIQGVYGKKPKLPAIVGNEGVSRVKYVGSDVKHLKPGDHAIPIATLGSWQSYSVRDSSDFFKVDPDVNLTDAAQLKVNPCTAYRMIKDFADLKPGDIIIQNGANSAVGIYAIQLAKLWGFKTINVIRDRPDKDKLVTELKDLGANYVVTDEEVGKAEIMSPLLKEIGKPKLLLNCVGGKNSIDCQRHLEFGGCSVTYGAMSRQPFSLSASSLIFKDHKYVGFWVSRWFETRLNSMRHEIDEMLDEIGQLFKQSTLKSKSTTLVDFEDRMRAFTGRNNTKYMFLINKV